MHWTSLYRAPSPHPVLTWDLIVQLSPSPSHPPAPNLQTQDLNLQAPAPSLHMRPHCTGPMLWTSGGHHWTSGAGIWCLLSTHGRHKRAVRIPLECFFVSSILSLLKILQCKLRNVSTRYIMNTYKSENVIFASTIGKYLDEFKSYKSGCNF